MGVSVFIKKDLRELLVFIFVRMRGLTDTESADALILDLPDLQTAGNTFPHFIITVQNIGYCPKGLH